jgi:hypothetical protein
LVEVLANFGRFLQTNRARKVKRPKAELKELLIIYLDDLIRQQKGESETR